mgnify:CR=1 FL=1
MATYKTSPLNKIDLVAKQQLPVNTLTLRHQHMAPTSTTNNTTNNDQNFIFIPSHLATTNEEFQGIEDLKLLSMIHCRVTVEPEDRQPFLTIIFNKIKGNYYYYYSTEQQKQKKGTSLQRRKYNSRCIFYAEHDALGRFSLSRQSADLFDRLF